MNEHDESQAHHGLSRLHERLRRMQRGQAAPPEAPLPITMLKGTAPIAAQQTVSLLVYPQDPLYSGPEIRTLPANEVERGLHNERVRIVDDVAIASPDQHGSYLYWPGTREFDQVNAFYYVTFTLRMLERYAGRMLPWSFADPRLKVRPNVGSRATLSTTSKRKRWAFTPIGQTARLFQRRRAQTLWRMRPATLC